MPAFYIVLQQKIPGVDAIGLDNHALSKHSRHLERLAQKAGVRPLISFFSANPEEVAGLLGDDEVAQPDVQIPDEKWFAAEEGLNTIAALLQSLADTPAAESATLTAELSEFQNVLETARSHNIRWHLGIDY